MRDGEVRETHWPCFVDEGSEGQVLGLPGPGSRWPPQFVDEGTGGQGREVASLPLGLLMSSVGGVRAELRLARRWSLCPACRALLLYTSV